MIHRVMGGGSLDHPEHVAGPGRAEGITSIAIPRIGVGYGGLSWKKVRAIVEVVFADWAGTLVVYEEFVAGDSAEAP